MGKSQFVGIEAIDAIVFEPEFPDRLAQQAPNFVRERFTLEKMSVQEIQNHPHGLNSPEVLATGLQNGTIIAYRIVRVGEFERVGDPSPTGLLSNETEPERGVVEFEVGK